MFNNNNYLDIELPLLYIHILAGFISLVVAYTILFLKKGDKRHKKFGMIYVYGMTTIFLTAIPLSLLGEFNPFLFIIAIFSFYLAFAGYRQGRDRQGARERVDIVLAIFIQLTFVVFYSFTISLFLSGNSMWRTTLLFGTVALGFGINDYFRLKKTEKPNYYDRTSTHLILMLSGTIATTTAFIVTIELFSAEWVNWTFPTFALVPVIIYFSLREKAKKT